MDLLEKSFIKKFLPKPLGLESIPGRLKNLVSLGSKRLEIRTLNLMEKTEEIHRNLLACSKRLVEYLLTGEALSNINHRACVRRSIRNRQEIKYDREEAQLDREKCNKNNKVRLRLERAKVVGAWLMVVPDLLNGATISEEEFRDNLWIRLELHPQGLIQTCGGCG